MFIIQTFIQILMATPFANQSQLKPNLLQYSEVELQLSITESARSHHHPSANASPIKKKTSSGICHEQMQVNSEGLQHPDEESESNLLDSTIQDKKRNLLTSSANLPHKSKIQSGKVPKYPKNEESKGHISDSSKQIILQSEIIELQMRCSVLMGVIHKMRKEQQKSSSPSAPDSQRSGNLQNPDSSVSLSSQNAAKSSLNCSKNEWQYIDEEIKGFEQLENCVQDYRSELMGYQEIIAQMGSNYDQKILILESEIKRITEECQSKDILLNYSKKENSEMALKNSELLMELERLAELESQSFKKKMAIATLAQTSKYESPNNKKKSNKNIEYKNSASSHKEMGVFSKMDGQTSADLDISINTRYSHMYQHPNTSSAKKQNDQSFSLHEYQECINEMEIIINKLTRALQIERKKNQIFMQENSRLCLLIQSSEEEMKKKNKKIYNLEKQMLALEANQIKGIRTHTLLRTSSNKLLSSIDKRSESSNQYQSRRQESCNSKGDQERNMRNGSRERYGLSKMKESWEKQSSGMLYSNSDYYDCKRMPPVYQINKPQPSNFPGEDYLNS